LEKNGRGKVLEKGGSIVSSKTIEALLWLFFKIATKNVLIAGHYTLVADSLPCVNTSAAIT